MARGAPEAPFIVPAIVKRETLVVVAEFLSEKLVDADGDGKDDQPGDYSLFYERLLGEDLKTVMGTNRAICRVHFKADVCSTTFLIKGRGSILADGVLDDTHSTLAIVGGTGQFYNARGQIVLGDVPGNDELLKFTVQLVP